MNYISLNILTKCDAIRYIYAIIRYIRYMRYTLYTYVLAAIQYVIK
jgi:hypothetical protein